MRSSSLTWKHLKRHRALYLLALPSIAYFIIFKYLPVERADRLQGFPALGRVLGSVWNGLTNFTNFFNSYYFTS
jgi:putative aldouronate transport system permease protein